MPSVWRHIAQSLPGSSHLAVGIRCQDSHRVALFGGNSRATLVACVADGAGSARYWDVGSSTACQAIVENAAAYFDVLGNFDSFSRDDALCWCDDAQSRIQAAADEQG